MNSVAHKSPLVEAIILRVIKRLEPQEIALRPTYTLNTDLIPRVHESITGGKTDLQESILQPHHIEKMRVTQVQQTQTQQIETKPIPVKPVVQRPMQMQTVTTKTFSQTTQRFPTPQHFFQKGYGKLQNLILDSGVSHIECQGPNTPVSVVKFGQTQKTNIVLSEQEIKDLFEYISEQANIPAVEGVFKIALGNILFNGIISDAIGSKFMIKKNFQVEDLSK